MISQKRKNKLITIICGYIFISPVVIGMLIFTAVPLIVSLYTSFTEYYNVGEHIWIGIANYQAGFKLPLFWKAMKNTFFYAGISIPVNMFGSFFLAYMLNAKIKGQKIYRAIFYSPCIIPTAASVIVFADLFNPTFGWFNQILETFGLPPYTFMQEVETAMPSMIIYSMWNMGSSMLIWLAAFNSVSTDLYEAAEIDGANWSVKLFSITFPLVSPVIFYNLVMGIIGGLQLFAQVYLMTNGGPLQSTTTIVMLIYNYGLLQMDMGFASAMAWILAFIIMILTAITFITRKFWVYSED